MVPDFLTIAEAGALIGKRELSPVELAESRLARIERLDGQLHSFIRVLREPALAAARAAEAEIMAGNYRRPLHGMVALLRQPRTAADEPAGTFSILNVTRGL